MKHFLFVLIIFVLSGTSARSENHEIPEPCPFPSLISKVRISEPMEFCGEPVELEKYEARERMEKELLLALWDRPQVVLWIKRSGRYMPLIEKMLKEQNMPEDLKYVPIVESALRPHAGSPKGAMGFWQFMGDTGRKYGLKIDSEKDERRNFYKSTEAAIAYFKELYEILGSWTLSAAAYNMGEQGLQAEILAQKNNHYYELYLPLETQRYIFRIISTKLIFSDPEKYGFRFTEKDLYPPVQFDRIKIECFQETPVLIIAQSANTSFKVIKDLNPEIRGHYVAAGSHSILIPEGASRDFHPRFKRLVDQWVINKQERIYVVKEGDNLTTIAERFNIPLPALMIWNRLEINRHIHPGDRLVIYPDEVGFQERNQE
jgi:membrane-bound lytic murein transglycosylase D